MAHADYNCCAVCDRKLDYNGGDAQTKEEICVDCLAELRAEGVSPLPLNPDELMAWMRSTPEAVAILNRAGFQCCFYANPVDALYLELTTTSATTEE